ncbi:hypothetical protein M378DRAFT_79709 [Amanita muscaria Koide BX008]|uniref:Uncharacterized protein n=1 Tax=Amanita muscaria (strain Koide BX008) TaxID=946122 RepID=A0A0C2SJN6_AMAMK|nr:hypothetical protein M378DRAFT_79709 [Amanita muscaria Koide BX008]
MSTSGTPVGPLLKVVFASILEVFLLCLSGYILAWKGVLDKKTQKQINRLNVSLFTPALLFSKVAFSLSPAKLQELWIIPIFFVLVTLVSMIVAYVLGTLFRLKPSQRSFAMAAAMFMNSNSLPIALMQSLVLTVPDLKWGEDDSKDSRVGRALTYLVLYSTLGMVIRWSYGVKLLSQADDEVQDVTAMVNERQPLLASGDGLPESYTGTMAEHPKISVSDEGPPLSPNVNGGRRLLRPAKHHSAPFYSFPNTPTMSRCELAPESGSSSSTASVAASDEESDSDDADQRKRSSLPFFRRSSKINDHPRRRKHSKSLTSHALRSINEFMTAPLWAATASLAVACIPVFQHALEQHMKPIKGAISSAGQCSIPLTLVVLGAYFYPASSDNDKDKDCPATNRMSGSVLENLRSYLTIGSSHDSSVEKRPGETKTVFVSVASRMFITPLILLPLMALGAKFEIQNVFSDPVFVVSNVLLLSSPPALTLAQITQAASGDAFERLISRTIFWSYCIVTPPMTIAYVVIGLILAKL